MMHPYFVATLLVGSVAVAYGAYLIYKELSEEPVLIYNTRGREGYQSSEDEDLSIIGSEKNGLRRRRKNNRTDEDEQELLDKYSYLNALEQEIERKKKQLVDEERILNEKEQEIQNRKQHLQSINSQSNSNTDSEISPLTSQRKASISSSRTSTSEIIVNDYHQPVFTEGTLPVVTDPSQSVVSDKTVSSDGNDQPINKFSDVAAHTILSQHLSHITHQQQIPNSSIIIQSSDISTDPTKINPSLTSERSNNSAGYHEIQQHNEHLYPVNNPHFVAKSIASEETWSEVDSVLSENIGSVMSSAVDIDMEEVDVIGH